MEPLEKKEKLIEEFKKKKAVNTEQPKDFKELGLEFLPETFDHFREFEE